MKTIALSLLALILFESAAHAQSSRGWRAPVRAGRSSGAVRAGGDAAAAPAVHGGGSGVSMAAPARSGPRAVAPARGRGTFGGGTMRRQASTGWGSFTAPLRGARRGFRGAEEPAPQQDGQATQFGALIRTNGLGARVGAPVPVGAHDIDGGGLLGVNSHNGAALGGGGTHWAPPDRLPPASPGGFGGASGGNSITPNNTIINTGNGVGNGNGGGGVGNGNDF